MHARVCSVYTNAACESARERSRGGCGCWPTALHLSDSFYRCPLLRTRRGSIISRRLTHTCNKLADKCGARAAVDWIEFICQPACTPPHHSFHTERPVGNKVTPPLLKAFPVHWFSSIITFLDHFLRVALKIVRSLFTSWSAGFSSEIDKERRARAFSLFTYSRLDLEYFWLYTHAINGVNLFVKLTSIGASLHKRYKSK